ncbi:flagellar M-ring protein FliF C-terminal domain-containing protein [Paraburkholderia mimosarum]|uniref:flagellar M-ring protein FliF C-terminal domain-containing protein n=1 Tax=Paraburkholderia mimosarum TaxID=312026 RepID=UPI000413F71B|nr:flagellar M-ring protein FliF C-terminal domain-containing protein [Paraburkholderia mimosarum]
MDSDTQSDMGRPRRNARDSARAEALHSPVPSHDRTQAIRSAVIATGAARKPRRAPSFAGSALIVFLGITLAAWLLAPDLGIDFDIPPRSDSTAVGAPRTASDFAGDSSQERYAQQVEHEVEQRIDKILTPVFGEGNVHSQVSADIDFSRSEETDETYRPNSDPLLASIRSQQLASTTEYAAQNASSTAGAASSATSQSTVAPSLSASSTSAVMASPVSVSSDSTTNYELDKTISHVTQPIGVIRRLSAAVVVSDSPTVNANGKIVYQSPTSAELAEAQQLVQEAMGYDPARGDSVSVVDSASTADDTSSPLAPWWRRPTSIRLAVRCACSIAVGLAATCFYIAIRKLIWRRSIRSTAHSPTLDTFAKTPPDASQDAQFSGGRPRYGRSPIPSSSAGKDDRIDGHRALARSIARRNPEITAAVVKDWSDRAKAGE